MPWTNVSLILNSRDRTGGSYNTARFNARDQNIIQGQIHSVSVNEINFPYDIPNMQDGYNFFEAESNGMSPAQRFAVTVPPGFYSGTELATIMTSEFLTAAQVIDPTLIAANVPAFTYDTTNGIFTVEEPVTPVAGYDGWALYSSYTFYSSTNPNRTYLGKDIFSIMGFAQRQGSSAGLGIDNGLLVGTAIAAPAFVSAAGAAPLVFTQYIDICSPELCQYQYFRDGSTTNLARQSDVICRLYISNNVATQEEEGARPFVIHRQFNNARVMRWSAESSIGQLSIQLYDDCGVPLKTSWEPRPYQITFNAYEQDRDSTTY